jgi:hypothetical protein
MSSVLFRFAGLSGYSPNRYYDSPVRPFVPAIAISAAIFVSCLALMFRAASSAPERLLFRSLLGGLATGIAQVLVLSFGLHQQIEYRHLSSLLPLLLLLILAGLSRASGQTLCAATALGLIWFISDARLLFSSEYRREDFRAAVKQSLELQSTEKQNGRAAVIALAADPLGAAYYGLSGEGPAPCFPLTGSCRDGLSDVGWLQKSPAAYALFWSEAQIKDWLQVQTLKHTDVILLISRGRHPTLKNSAWWPIVQSRANVSLYQKHGFSIYLLH